MTDITDEQIRRWAAEADAYRYTNRHYPDEPTFTFSLDRLRRFAELTRQEEREACAEIARDE